MKFLLVISTLLVILISIFLFSILTDSGNRQFKRDTIQNRRFKKPSTRMVSFVDEITAHVTPKTVVGPVLITPEGNQELLKMGSFIDRFYSQKDLTEAKTHYEAEALSVWDRYRQEERNWKRENERYQLRL